jgi:glycosyltransferase involved in cell wall biosynthesis
MKVTIITTVYNNRDYIIDCIQSVNSQTYSNIEHIIIDGGSTDGTQQAVEPFKNKLAWFISEKDKGLYNALNKGIKLATGDIIGVLHSDDLFYDKKTISQIVKTFEETNTDLVYANGQYISPTKSLKGDLKESGQLKVRRIYTSKSFKKRYLPFGWIPLHTTIYVRKEVFERYGLYEEHYRIASDYEISLRWFLNNQIKKHFMNDWVVKMRLGGKSTTFKLQKRKSKEDLNIIQRYHLCSWFTLGCKIARKIPQYVLPRFIKY